ncbi:MAG TPA: trypsin-like peptidase domain-containing protein [Saprospiraceae bacterium]|nr:trypsin-like peptidase domain-containing protein [Saprospiraceae bacterium]
MKSMNKPLCIITLVLCLLSFEKSFGQTTPNPYVAQSNIENCKVVEVKIENDRTTVTMEYEKTKSNAYQAWVSFSSSTYISDYYNNNYSYKIVSLGRDQLDTKYSTTGKKGQKYYFTLIFPKLPPGIEKINIKEVTYDNTGFEWRGISIKNPDNSPKSEWTEASLKTFWQTNGNDFLEGIYENAIQSANSPKYKLALKKSATGYDLIYLSGDNGQTTKFKEGDIKAYLTKTAKDNLLKAKWIMGDKSINENLYITFEDALMKIIWTDGSPEQLYIKLYPTSSTPKNSNGIASSGTGFALTSNGYIVTNYHVVDGATSIVVKGVNGNFSTTYKAKVVVSDKNNDLAIIQIDDNTFNSISKIPYTIKSTSSDVGENVFVLGYPLRASMGDEIKLTNGIISSKTGFQGDITSYQISAPVQPGNSGGPLFDKLGNLIGVINAKHTGAENVSYAIKVSYLKNVIDLLPTTPTLSNTNTLTNLSLSDQVKLLNKFVYIIEIK